MLMIIDDDEDDRLFFQKVWQELMPALPVSAQPMESRIRNIEKSSDKITRVDFS